MKYPPKKKTHTREKHGGKQTYDNHVTRECQDGNWAKMGIVFVARRLLRTSEAKLVNIFILR